MLCGFVKVGLNFHNPNTSKINQINVYFSLRCEPKRRLSATYSVAYSIIRIHIQKNQLVCGYQELVEWLERLHATAQITQEEIDDLLQRAHYLKVPDLTASELIH
jgi:hypothetical protein